MRSRSWRKLNVAERGALVAFVDGTDPVAAPLGRLCARGLLTCSRGAREVRESTLGGWFVVEPRIYSVTDKGRAVVAKWRAESRVA